MLNPSFPLPLTLKSKQRQKWGQHILTLNSPGRSSEWRIFSSLTFDVSGGRSNFHACLRHKLEYERHSGVSKLTLHLQRVLYCTSSPSRSEFVSASDVNIQCYHLSNVFFFFAGKWWRVRTQRSAGYVWAEGRWGAPWFPRSSWSRRTAGTVINFTLI